MVEVDVALVPAQARAWAPRVCVAIDELRASSTITTLLDLDCGELLLTSSLEGARRLARARGDLLAGERNGRTPPGFDANNSPTELARAAAGGRGVVLCTTNGTRVLGQLQEMRALLVGCLLNARACAGAALRLAAGLNLGIGLVCAGQRGRFALDDAVAAGFIVERLVALAERQGRTCRLSDAAQAALALARAYPDPLVPLRASWSGRLLHELGVDADVAWCARVDASESVGVVRPGTPLRVERLSAA